MRRKISAASAMVVVFLLTGCPSEPAERSEFDYIADEVTTLRVEQALEQQYPGVRVDVRGGKVTLRGNVRSEEERRSAVAAARGVHGVEEVTDEIEVLPGGETEPRGRARSGS